MREDLHRPHDASPSGEPWPEVPRRAPDEPPSFFDRRRNVRRLIVGLFVLCGGLVLADLLYAKHVHFGVEQVFGFYGVYGYVCCFTLVLLARGLRRLVLRDEDYYDRREADDAL